MCLVIIIVTICFTYETKPCIQSDYGELCSVNYFICIVCAAGVPSTMDPPRSSFYEYL